MERFGGRGRRWRSWFRGCVLAGWANTLLQGLRHAGAGTIVIALTATIAGYLFDVEQSAAQNTQTTVQMQFPQRPTQPKASQPSGDPPMLVQSDEIRYNYSEGQVSAVGNVQIYYGGATIEADKVIYDQKTKRLHAEGNVRLTEPGGNITYGQMINLTDDYRDGFVDSLRLETADNTRFAASRADRAGGNYTVLNNGVYTACEPCKEDPKKPPLWQVKAARIIHSEGEKMIYFEDAKIEFFGVPMAYVPFMSAPDPTVKRKSGVLFSTITSTTQYGVGIEIPYYLALGPNYDMTFTTDITTRQGVLEQIEWRHRLINGSYSIQAAGIFQQDPGYFASRDGATSDTAKSFRGVAQTSGQFKITDKWSWGWTGFLLTDPSVLSDYRLSNFGGYTLDPFRTSAIATEALSQVYLTGRGDRSYFDIRTLYYYGLSQVDVQNQLPIVHPVLDYSNVLAQPVLGGELGYKMNLTSLTRNSASFDPISQTAVNNNLCTSLDPTVKIPANCLLRGIPGTYSRVSAELDWRRTVVTADGQMFTPFVTLRADAAATEVGTDPGVSNYISTGDNELLRTMPTVGLEYRYPFINVQPWGTQTIEPIAQVILRPNETQIGKFPNEDAQSLVFDDSNLFRVDKFSGWDRVEGGSRLNAGIEYTAQVNKGGSLNALFGQSYQLFGANSFAIPDIANTGLGSGLDTTQSDYVARVNLKPNQFFSVTARTALDPDTLAVHRFELENRVAFDRWNFSVIYANYAAQPQLGFLTRREGVITSATVKLNQNWVLLGSARYDIFASQFDQTRVGLGYVDDCLLLAVNWLTGYTYNGTSSPTLNNTFMLQMSMRTLGANSLR